jgi:hypothetical protein
MRGMAIRFNLRTAFGLWTVAACVCFVFFAARWCLGPIASQATLSRLKVGMTADEVEEILGSPSDRTESREWIYERPPNPGWLNIAFDENARFVRYSHEPVFP